MIISFEASANVDSDYLGYFSMKYDPELFSDIKENITEISKPETLSFSLDTDDIKLLYGTFHYLRKMISIPEVENNKFTDKLKIVEAAGVPHTVTPEFKAETLAWLERWLK